MYLNRKARLLTQGLTSRVQLDKGENLFVHGEIHDPSLYCVREVDEVVDQEELSNQ